MKTFEQILADVQKISNNARLISDIDNVEAISTGLPFIDFITCIGGVPKGRITEIYGPESAGKTTLALYTLAEAQKKGEVCAFIDVEHAISPDHMLACGVDPNKLIFIQPDTAEEALNLVETLVIKGVQFIVLDSVAKLVPRKEYEGDVGDQLPGMLARLMSQALRKIVPVVKKNNATIIFVNQIRHKIGVMFGSPETTPGGLALKFDSSLRLEVRSKGKIKGGSDIHPMGQVVKVTTVKNKVGIPRMVGQFNIRYNAPRQNIINLLEIAKELDIVQTRGAWSYYITEEGEQTDLKFQGAERFAEHLEQHPELYDEIYARVMNSRDKLGAFTEYAYSTE